VKHASDGLALPGVNILDVDDNGRAHSQLLAILADFRILLDLA
jgi:hypothetical protein